MSRLELDDQILNHPKFIRAVKLGGSEAIHLWLGLRAYCGQHLSDGFIPTDMLDEVRGPKGKGRAVALQALVDVGLLEQRPDGYELHDFLDWSRSRAQVLADRARARERQTKSRDVSRRDSGGSNGSGHPDPSGSVTMASSSASSSADLTHKTRARPPDPLAESLATPADELPDGWNPATSAVSLAQSLGLVLDDEAAEYRLWCRRDKRVCGNWDADFELWLRRSKRFSRERQQRRGAAPGGPSEDWPTDADLSLREQIRGGEHGSALRKKLELGQLDAALARRLIRERKAERDERRRDAGLQPVAVSLPGRPA